MGTRDRFLLGTVVVAGILFLAGGSPAAAIPFCNNICDCEESCSSYCTFIIIIGGEPQTVESTCGEWGSCTTTQNCNGCDNLSCTDTINGTSGNDTLNGDADHECIYGLGGNDTIDGNAGDDRIECGPGTDTAYGDSGNDCLWGEDGNDHLDGESGSDFVDGGAGTDTCTGEMKVNCP